MRENLPNEPHTSSHETSQTILVTGATGFVGGLLVPRLLAMGFRVRCLTRDAERLSVKPWYAQVDVVIGDLAASNTLVEALAGVSAAYYLVHNMSIGSHYPEQEAAAAQNFADAAHLAGVGHIIYLGGLADPGDPIGKHLWSRLQTGETLRRGKVPVTEFRSSLIIGSGSISFEMIRFMTEQTPILVGPRWVNYLCQPISILNVLDYLLSALEMPSSKGKIYEIGGTDVLKYADVMRIYAQMRGLKRPFWIFPYLPVSWMATMVDKMTPVKFTIAHPLLDGMRSHSLVRDESSLVDFPHIRRDGYGESVSAALQKLSPDEMGDVLLPGESHANMKREGFFIAARRLHIDAPAEAVFAAITGLGGHAGWYFMSWLWEVRGWIDRRLGGPGMRGRRSLMELQIGDILDFYRVDELIPGRKLRLKAELAAPGDGWMEWQVRAQPAGGTILTQQAFFAPRGIWGFLYWYIFSPFHQLVFTGLSRAIARQAQFIHRKRSA